MKECFQSSLQVLQVWRTCPVSPHSPLEPSVLLTHQNVVPAWSGHVSAIFEESIPKATREKQHRGYQSPPKPSPFGTPVSGTTSTSCLRPVTFRVVHTLTSRRHCLRSTWLNEEVFLMWSRLLWRQTPEEMFALHMCVKLRGADGSAERAGDGPNVNSFTHCRDTDAINQRDKQLLKTLQVHAGQAHAWGRNEWLLVHS